MLSENRTDLAYAAGIVDGEGSICITRSAKHGTHYYLGRVAVSNTNLELLQWLEANFGGQIYVCAEKNRVIRGHNQVWQWSLATQVGIDKFLRSIYPYLKVKKQQADVMLDFLHSRLVSGSNTDLAENYYQVIGNLNGKPKSARSNSLVGQ